MHYVRRLRPGRLISLRHAWFALKVTAEELSPILLKHAICRIQILQHVSMQGLASWFVKNDLPYGPQDVQGNDLHPISQPRFRLLLQKERMSQVTNCQPSISISGELLPARRAA